MTENNDTIMYMMAAEKMTTMLMSIEQTLKFMQDSGIKPDEQVKIELEPLIGKLRSWIDGI